MTIITHMRDPLRIHWVYMFFFHSNLKQWFIILIFNLYQGSFGSHSNAVSLTLSRRSAAPSPAVDMKISTTASTSRVLRPWSTVTSVISILENRTEINKGTWQLILYSTYKGCFLSHPFSRKIIYLRPEPPSWAMICSLRELLCGTLCPL